MPTVSIDRAQGGLANRVSGAELANPFDQIAEKATQYAEDIKRSKDINEVANLSTDTQIALQDLQDQVQREYFDNPAGYRDALIARSEPLYAAAVEAANSREAKNSLTSIFQGMRSSQLAQANAWETSNLVASYTEKFEQSTNALSNMVGRNPNSYGDAVAQMNVNLEAMKETLSPEQYLNAKQAAEETLSTSYLIGLAEHSPSAAAQELASGKYDELFTPAQMQRVENGIEAIKNKKEVEARKARNAYLDTNYTDVSVALSQAETSGDVELAVSKLPEMLESGQIDPGRYEKLLNTAEKKFNKLLAEEEVIQMVNDSLEQGRYMDDQKAIDTYYEKYVASEDTSPEAVLQAATFMVERTGTLPTQIKKQFSSAVNSVNPTTAAAAARWITGVTKLNPKAGNNFTNDDIAKSFAIIDNISSGMSEEQATAMVQELEKGENIPQTQVRIKKYGSSTKTVDKQIEESLGEDVPDEMRMSIRNQAKNNYVVNKMNIAPAVDSAIVTAQKQWAKTKYSETPDSWAYLPPEAVYGNPDGNNKWIDDQLVTAITKETLNIPENLSKYKGPITERYNQEVLNTVSKTLPFTADDGKISYRILLKNEANGVPQLLMADDGVTPVIFRPDYYASEEGKKALQIRQEAEARAQKRREEAISRSGKLAPFNPSFGYGKLGTTN